MYDGSVVFAPCYDPAEHKLLVQKSIYFGLWGIHKMRNKGGSLRGYPQNESDQDFCIATFNASICISMSAIMIPSSQLLSTKRSEYVYIGNIMIRWCHMRMIRSTCHSSCMYYAYHFRIMKDLLYVCSIIIYPFFHNTLQFTIIVCIVLCEQRSHQLLTREQHT